MQKLKWALLWLLPQRLVGLQVVVFLVIGLIVFTQPASAVTRFLNRSLMIYNSAPGATTKYVVTFTYNTVDTVGSIDMLFCNDPIPTDPCHAPAGLDVSHAVLADQSGETGFSLLNSATTTNHLVLTRTPTTANSIESQYVLTGIVNPTETLHSFAIRLSDYSSTDASGSLIDLGSVITQIETTVLTLQAQVPPMLIFCLNNVVDLGCDTTQGLSYTDMGVLDPNTTLTASSQMAIGTNASGGYVVTVNGTPMAAGTHVLTPPNKPTVSAPGNTQFGINLVANTEPKVGSDPDGDSTNAIAAPNYDIPNKFMYKDGDIVASAPNVSLMRRFTVSYIANTDPKLHAGVYTTTLTFICTGRF